VREGRDRTASTEFTLRAGSATVDAVYTGSGVFHAYFYDQTTSLTTTIVSRDYLTTGGVHAERVQVTGLVAGRYVVRVSSADGPWQFTISQP
jgi:hypothetical protein